MQKPILPIQISGAGAAPARAKNAQPEGGAQFKQALHREVEQRKAPPAPAKQNGPAKQSQAQAQQHDKAGAPKKTGAEPARVTKESRATVADDASSQAVAAAVLNPALDMLALVASLNLPASTVAAPAEATTDPLLSGAAAPGMDGKFAAAAATAGMDKLAATGAALLAGASDGAAPEVHAAVFGDMMAKQGGNARDGVKPAGAENATPMAPDKVAPGKVAPGKDMAAANLSFEAGQGKAMLEPGQFAQVRGRETAQPEALPKDMQVSAPASAPVQQASLAMAHAANGAGAGDKIAARVGTPAWENQVGQKIVWMVGGKEQSATLTLNPPDMGPMKVVLSVTNEHATVTFSSATPEVRQALEDAMPKLREMMSESGIALGNASVNDGAAQQQQQAREDAGARPGRGPGRDDGGASGSAAQAEAKAAERPTRSGELPALVDTFA